MPRCVLADTSHHIVSMAVITPDDLGDGCMPTGCAHDEAADGYHVDLQKMTDATELQLDEMATEELDEGDDELMQGYYDRVCDILEEEENGTPVTPAWLAKKIGVRPHLVDRLRRSGLRRVFSLGQSPRQWCPPHHR